MVLQDAQKGFDIISAKSKQFYKLLLSRKAKLPNMSNRLITDFEAEDTLEKIYLLPCLAFTMLQVKHLYGPFSTDCWITYCLLMLSFQKLGWY